MHDFGDLLVENGFADPVMDQEILTLTYRSPEKLLQDVRALGGNPAEGRRGGRLVGRNWRDRLYAALEAQRRPDGVIALSIEVAYGHAWRPPHRAATGETRLSVSAIGGRLPQSLNRHGHQRRRAGRPGATGRERPCRPGTDCLRTSHDQRKRGPQACSYSSAEFNAGGRAR